MSSTPVSQRHHRRMIPSPIRWVGGKSRLRRTIISMLPAHHGYIEVFGGAAWVLFGKEPSPLEVLNDRDADLITFFRVVKTQPEAFIQSFDFTLVGRAEFNRLREQDPAQLSEVERAHRFFYLLMASWGGEWAYPRFQTSFNDRGHGNRLIGAIKQLHQRIQPVYERLKTVIIECLDWRDCLDRYDRPGMVLYLDPPYAKNCCNYVHQMRDPVEHVALADRLRAATCHWIVSGYDNALMRDLYADYAIVPVTFPSGMEQQRRGAKRLVNREVLITNVSQ